MGMGKAWLFKDPNSCFLGPRRLALDVLPHLQGRLKVQDGMGVVEAGIVNGKSQ